MATGHDQAVGWAMVSLSSFIFVYYSIWVIVLPFVEPGVFVHKLFPPRIYAIAGPLLAGVCALALIRTVCMLYLSEVQKERKVESTGRSSALLCTN